MTAAPSFADLFGPDTAPTFDWPANVDHVSASALKTFAACPEQYRRRYLQGERIPPGAAAVWGSADHTAAEHNYRQKIDTHVDLPLTEVEDRYVTAVDEKLEEYGGMNELDWSGKFQGEVVKGITGRKRVIADVKDRGVKLAAIYHQDAAPKVQPIAVEQPFTVQVDGCPVPLIGYQDLIAETAQPPLADLMAEVYGFDKPEPPNRRLIDRKTSAKKVNKPDAEWRIQSAIYQLADWLPHEWHVSVKGKRDLYVIQGEPALLIAASTARKRWVEKFVRGLVAELGWCYLTFGADDPWPASRALVHSWRCDYCGYEPTCPWRRG